MEYSPGAWARLSSGTRTRTDLPAERGGVRRTGTLVGAFRAGPLTTCVAVPLTCRHDMFWSTYRLPISLPCADQTILIILRDRASSSAAGSQTPCLRMGRVISCWLGSSAWCWSLPCTRLPSPILRTTCWILLDITLVFLFANYHHELVKSKSESELGVTHFPVLSTSGASSVSYHGRGT